MSDRKLRIILSEPSREDLRDIFAFTLRRWGDDQLKTYRRMVEQAFDAIIADPVTGRTCHGYLRMTVGRYYIYYRVEPDAIYIVRILHDRMDAVRHLTGQSSVK